MEVLRFISDIFSPSFSFRRLRAGLPTRGAIATRIFPDATARKAPLPDTVQRMPATGSSSPRRARKAKSPHEAGFLVKRNKNAGYADQNGYAY